MFYDFIGRRVLYFKYRGLKHMYQYIVYSERTRLGLIEKLGVHPERIHIVPRTVELANFRIIPNAREQITRRYNFPPLIDGFDLIYVGTELPRKNLNLLLRAIAVLKNQGYCLRLIKIGSAGGDQWRESTLNEIARLNLRENVVFPGTVPEEDLPLFYNAADLAVTPTLLESGFAWMAMEAMACGKSVVASKDAAIPEDAYGAATIYESRSLDGLISAIARHLDDADMRRRMGEVGSQVIQKYTWENSIASILQVYEKTL